MRVAQGGTRMYCPRCKCVRVCEAICPTRLGHPSRRLWYKRDNADLQLFRRGRRCLACSGTFVSAEVEENFLDELVQLRGALAQIKKHAEAYIKESDTAAESLKKLAGSLQVLRALRLYNDA